MERSGDRAGGTPGGTAGGEDTPVRFRAIDIGSTLGRYRIVEELGAGGMATVYRAEDLELRRDVALKVMFPHLSKRREAVARFHREARAAAALDHPGIVRVHDVGGGEGTDTAAGGAAVADPPYLVMELVAGRSLDEHVAERGPFLAEVVACIGVVLCRALGAAHRAGIIHRDVKPANILVTRRGRVALADFGVARIEDDDSSLVTRSGMLLGTPAFMSPEQAMGDPLDERSDLYSLGATLYQLATGSLPYGGSTARVMTAIAEGGPVPPLQRNPAMGAELSRIIERMMAREPDLRYPSADQAATALGAVIEDAGLDSAPGMPEAELGRFFADPETHTRELTPRVVATTLQRARQAARQRRLPRAMALADRVLALDPECQEAMALVQRLGASRQQRYWLMAACAALAVTGAAGGLAAWRAHRATIPAPLAVAAAPALDSGPADTTPPEAAGTSDRTPDGPPPEAAGTSDRPPPEAAGTSDDGTSRRPPEASPEAAGTPDRGTSRRRRRPPPEAAGTSDRTSDRRPPPEAAGTPDGPPPEAAGTSPEAAGTSDRDRPPPEAAGTSPEPPPEAAGTSDRPPPEAAGTSDRGTSPEAAGTSPAAGVAPAKLSVDIKPWCDLYIDEVAHGRARRDRIIALPPGRHELVCTQGPGRAAWREAVRLAPGERRHFTGSVLQPVRVRVAVRSGDAVLVNTRRHRNGDTLALKPGRHRVAVLANGKQVSAAWVSIPAIGACTLRDQPALDCYR